LSGAVPNRSVIGARLNDPGHDPRFRLTRRLAGKTITESFPNPAALRKAQQEAAEFRRFQELSDQLVAINEKICVLRPVEAQRGGWTAQEKKGCYLLSGGGAGNPYLVEPHLCRAP
jgi:uncharacterized protein DUF6788